MNIYLTNRAGSITELVECLKYNFKDYNFITNLNEANIIIFNDFSLDTMKIIKNKQLNNKKLYCYIHEPLTDNNDANYNKKILRRLNLNLYKNIPIITYSKTNIEILKKQLGIERKYYYLPLNYYLYDDITFNKKYNICINHRGNSHKVKESTYNNSIINMKELEEKNKDLILFNHYGEKRDELFRNLKIFINIHRKKSTTVFETLRIHNLIYNRVIVISQKCKDNLDYLSKYIIFVKNNELINKAYDVLRNYDFYYNKIYGKITNKEIFLDIQNNYKIFYNSLSLSS